MITAIDITLLHHDNIHSFKDQGLYTRVKSKGTQIYVFYSAINNKEQIKSCYNDHNQIEYEVLKQSSRNGQKHLRLRATCNCNKNDVNSFPMAYGVHDLGT